MNGRMGEWQHLRKSFVQPIEDGTKNTHTKTCILYSQRKIDAGTTTKNKDKLGLTNRPYEQSIIIQSSL